MKEQQTRSIIRRARFDEVNCVMYMNGAPLAETPITASEFGSHSLNRSQTSIDSSDAAIKKLKKENHALKKTLSRRWSSKSRTSTISQVLTADDENDEDGNDDSLYLLRETSTLHGLRDVLLSSSGRLKFTWVAIITLALIMTLQGCYQILLEYTMRRIVVSYFIQEAESINVPDVVICPYNRFNRSFLEERNVSFELAQYLELSYPSLELPFEFLKTKRDEIVEKVDQFDFQLEELLKMSGNMSYVDFLSAASLGCSAFFKEKGRCDNITEIMTSAGKCFRFQGSRQEASGFGNGDRLIIDLPEQLYNPGVNQMINSGVIVKLAESGKGIDNDLTFLPSGVHAIMPLLGTQYEFMNDPPRYECEEDLNGTYSRVYCYEDCLTSEAQMLCECSPAAATHPAHPRHICTAKQLYHCFFPALFNMYEGKVGECKKKCKPPCQSWSYNKQVSYSTIPSSSTLALMGTMEDWTSMKSKIILDIYYSQLDYTVIKHVVAMPLQSLIAQIGGQFSLWAGGSLISLFQIIIYLTRYVLHRFFGLKSRRQRDHRRGRDYERGRSRERAREHQSKVRDRSRGQNDSDDQTTCFKRPTNGNGKPTKLEGIEMITRVSTETISPPL